MVKSDICLEGASKQIPFFFRKCALEKRTHAPPMSRIGADPVP